MVAQSRYWERSLVLPWKFVHRSFLLDWNWLPHCAASSLSHCGDWGTNTALLSVIICLVHLSWLSLSVSYVAAILCEIRKLPPQDMLVAKLSIVQPWGLCTSFCMWAFEKLQMSQRLEPNSLSFVDILLDFNMILKCYILYHRIFYL